MDSTGQLVLTLRPFGGGVGATEVLILFVLNTEEFVLRDEGEVFQHFVGFCYHLRSLRLLLLHFIYTYVSLNILWKSSQKF
jgi:hypothetical protein